MTLDEIINREQPRTIDNLIRLIYHSGYVVKEVRLQPTKGVRVTVFDPASGARTVLPPRSGYYYSIFR